MNADAAYHRGGGRFTGRITIRVYPRLSLFIPPVFIVFDHTVAAYPTRIAAGPACVMMNAASLA